MWKVLDVIFLIFKYNDQSFIVGDWLSTLIWSQAFQ